MNAEQDSAQASSCDVSNDVTPAQRLLEEQKEQQRQAYLDVPSLTEIQDAARTLCRMLSQLGKAAPGTDGRVDAAQLPNVLYLPQALVPLLRYGLLLENHRFDEVRRLSQPRRWDGQQFWGMQLRLTSSRLEAFHETPSAGYQRVA